MPRRLHQSLSHATTGSVTAPHADISGSTASADAARAWEAVHGDGSIQFAPLAPAAPPKPPEWLNAVGDFLRDLLEPVGRALGLSWPILQYVLLGLGIVLALWLAWKIASPYFERPPATALDAGPDWAPDRGQAVALLEDADALAAEGRYGEAAHLLLQRSVQHIAHARPDWLIPASTAREIARFPQLPDAARRAFAIIAIRVERSLFALRALELADWQAARNAYADFALTNLGRTNLGGNRR